MSKLARFFLTSLVAAFITMIFIFIIKKASSKFNIPGVRTIADGV